MTTDPFHSPFSSRPILAAAAADHDFRPAPIEEQKREAGYDFLERIGRMIEAGECCGIADLTRLWRTAVWEAKGRSLNLEYQNRLSARIADLEESIAKALRDERERCAQIADAAYKYPGDEKCEEIAAAIRRLNQ